MPITRAMLEKYVSPTFLETGTFTGEAVELALKLGFTTVHTIEIDPKRVRKVRAKNLPNTTVYEGSGPDVLARILPGIEGPITFWLDSHPFQKPMDIFLTKFPLMRELRAIHKYAKPGAHVIAMDDMRIVPPWELAILKFGIQLLWPHAVLRFEGDRYCEDDIMVADLRGSA
jgi:hypothetical protein